MNRILKLCQRPHLSSVSCTVRLPLHSSLLSVVSITLRIMSPSLTVPSSMRVRASVIFSNGIFFCPKRCPSCFSLEEGHRDLRLVSVSHRVREKRCDSETLTTLLRRYSCLITLGSRRCLFCYLGPSSPS
jgi:hypothetical protein